MSTPPINLNGLIRVDTKQTDLTLGQYNGNARPGELIVDLTTFDTWVANLDGFVNPVNNPLGFQPSKIQSGNTIIDIPAPNSNINVEVNDIQNVITFNESLTLFGGNLIPSADSVYGLGNATHQWKDLWLSGSTAYVGGVEISEIGGQIAINGNVVTTANATGALVDTNVAVTGNMYALGDSIVTLDSDVGGNVTVGGEISAGDDIVTPSDFTAVNFNTTGDFLAVSDTTITGNLSGNNFSMVDLNSSGNMLVTGTTTADTGLVTDTITGQVGGITFTAVGVNQGFVIDPSGTGNIDVGGALISNLIDPPVNDSDMSTKSYAESMVSGLTPKDPVKAATTIDLATLTGGSVTYNNGTAGVGATLNMASGLTTIDGVVLLVGDRVLIKDEVNTAHNGIYVFTDSFTLTRATDSDTPAELAGGSFIFTRSGFINGGNAYTIIVEPTTIGVDPITFVQLGGEITYSATNGLFIGGTALTMGPLGTAAIYNDTSNSLAIQVNSFGQFVSGTPSSVGPIPSLTVSNNLTVANLAVNSNLNINSTFTIEVTGTIAGATFNGVIQGANFFGRIDGNILTVSSITSGTLGPNQLINTDNGTSYTFYNRIVRQLTGPTGREGTYELQQTLSVSSRQFVSTGDNLIVTSNPVGVSINVGQTVTGTGVIPGTVITQNVTGFGGIGTYKVNNFQVVRSQTLAVSGSTLNVTNVNSGVLGVGQTISGIGVTPGTTITALGTGTGGIGTYTVSTPQLVYPSVTITSSSMIGNLNVGPISIPGWATFGGNVTISGNAIVNRDGTLGNIRATRLDATGGISNVGNIVVNNLSNGFQTINQFERESYIRNTAAFSRVVDLRANSNITLTGGSVGNYLVSNGASGVYWGDPTLNTTTAVNGNLSITGQLSNPRLNLMSVYSGSYTSPLYWDTSRGQDAWPNSSGAFIVKEVKSYSYGSGFQLSDNNGFRGVLYRRSVSSSDLQVRDRPLLFEMQVAVDFPNNSIRQSLGHGFSVYLSNLGIATTNDGSSTNTNRGYFMDFNFDTTRPDIPVNTFSVIEYYRRENYSTNYRTIINSPKSSIRYQENGYQKISFLYIYPSGNNIKWLFTFLNDNLLFASPVENNSSRDWTLDDTRGFAYGIIADSQSGINCYCAVNRYYVGSGQEAWYRYGLDQVINTMRT